MARLARLVIPGIPHHITHRGNRRADVFVHPQDYEIYLSFLRQYAAKAGLQISAYCLMTNHVHLVAVPEREDSLARGVGLAHRRYAVWLNKREGWSGHLWANRYFSTALDDAHHYEAVRYVERNPVRARMVRRAEHYRWSSAGAHCGLIRDETLDGGNDYARWDVGDWSAWLAEPEDTERLLALRRCTASGRPCGSDVFIETLQQRLGKSLRPNKRGRKPTAQRGEAEDETADMFA